MRTTLCVAVQTQSVHVHWVGTHRSRKTTCAAKSKRRQGPMGFIEEDNSGKANIFAVEPKTLYTSSPRSDRVASQGLGGSQGLILVLALAGLVAISTVALSTIIGSTSSSTNSSGTSLQELAERLM